jgi:hypothetical protein
MTDVQKTPPPQPYQAKGPQNDGGYRPSRENGDDLFREEDGGDYTSKGPQNDGGYGVRKDKAKDDVVRKEEEPVNHDPLFTDKVDISFKK